MTTTNGSHPRRELEFTLPIGYANGDSVLRREGALRKLTGRDEAILADRANQRNGGKLVTELIHSCITRFEGEHPLTKAEVANWYSADRNYVLLRLRSFTFGPELEARYTCGACGENIDVVENLDELPVRSIGPDEALEDVVVELEDGYWDTDNQCHSSVTLTLPRGVDEAAVAPAIRKNPSLGKNALLSRCIKSFGDMPAHRVEALGAKLLADLTLTDRRLIDKALNRAAPGVDLLREIECPSCGEQNRTSLDMTHFLVMD
jgi:cytochrome c5